MTRTDSTLSKTPVEELRVGCYRVPTDSPEADGTLSWDATTIVVCEASAGDERGIGYTYGDMAVGALIESKLASVVCGADAMAVQRQWLAMVKAVRNLGRPGISSMAVACVDVALWDLKARLLHLPLAELIGPIHEQVAVYGSGGFTSYSTDELCGQLRDWVDRGIGRVKMKVGSDPEQDPERVRAAREAIGPGAELLVDANGAYERKQALALADQFAEQGVTWFEEPVSSDDLEGLRLLRDRGPAGMRIAAGEYGYDLFYFRRMLEAGAVDVLQPDATRCAGATGFLAASALCKAHGVPLSAHTAPAVHAHLCACCEPSWHLEYFHDHVRIEQLLFEGAQTPVEGALTWDSSRPGLGLEFNREEAAAYAQ